MLNASEEEMERRYRLKARGYGLKELANHVARLVGLKGENLLTRGQYKGVVEGRSLLCYWAVRELGLSATELARRIGISQPAVSYSVQRGEKIAKERHLTFSPN